MNQLIKIVFHIAFFSFASFSQAQKIDEKIDLPSYERAFIKKSVTHRIQQSKEYKKTREACIELKEMDIFPSHCEIFPKLLNGIRIYPEKGDLSGKGRKDVAALIVFFIGSGTSSFRQHVFAFLRKDDGTLMLADSIDLKSTRGGIENFRIEDGFIMMESLQYKDGDAGCCPSARKPVKYKVESGKLIEVLAK